MQLSSISLFGRAFRVFSDGGFSRITTFESEEKTKDSRFQDSLVFYPVLFMFSPNVFLFYLREKSLPVIEQFRYIKILA